MSASAVQQQASRDPVDLAIIGAGIAGGALAVAAARAGVRVLLLERTEQHQDRVRGEFMPPWGVAEARRLGVLDVFLAAGGHYVTHAVGYGEGVDPVQAESRALPLGRLLPGVEGALTFGHPQVCTALCEAAQAQGAELLRGVSRVEVTPGPSPSVHFEHHGVRQVTAARLVVAADGRGSVVARGLGADVHASDNGLLLCGLLVDGAEGWPEDRLSIGTEGDLVFYVFPQGGGRVRLYACYCAEQRTRFSGPGNAARLLAAFRLACAPASGALAQARPIGPCHGYPGGDTWLERPGAQGVVLVGDAAGHNCPSIGQGVSIALRDVRHIVEAFAEDGGWRDSAFDAYCEERAERMRRLRFVARVFAALRADFTAEGQARRMRALARMAADPGAALPLVASQLGPSAVPLETFTQAAYDRLLA